jgi:hypothetical protein
VRLLCRPPVEVFLNDEALMAGDQEAMDPSIVALTNAPDEILKARRIQAFVGR